MQSPQVIQLLQQADAGQFKLYLKRMLIFQIVGVWLKIILVGGVRINSMEMCRFLDSGRERKQPGKDDFGNIKFGVIEILPNM